MPCPTCAAETRDGQRFCIECGAALDPGTIAPTRQLPGVTAAPSAAPTIPIVLASAPPTATPSEPSPPVTPVPGAPVDAGPSEPVPIRIVEQTSPLPAVTGVVTPPHEVAGVVWRSMAVDPWPTPRSSPTVVPAPLRPVPLTLAGIAAAALAIAGSLMTVGSYEFGDGTTGRFTLDDLRSNSLPVMVAAVAVLVLGVGLVLGGHRIGAGLAGGAAVAVTSMATMDAALVVAQLHEARRVGLATGVATITWEPGFYAVVAAGALGLVAAAVALTAWREAGPAVPAVAAALGAIAATATVVGPLLPTDGRTWGDNLAIPGFGTLPSWLRLGALALVGVAATLGFASRRRWAAGLAVGAITALVAQRIGAVSPPTPNRRGGPGLAITPLVDAAQTVHTIGLVAVVVLALVGWIVAERHA